MFDEMKSGQQQVIAHFRDGTMLKGYTRDFTPPRKTFTIASKYDVDNITEIDISDLKALFFVKTFEGDKDYVEKNTFAGVDIVNLQGLKVKVVFPDGEIIRGTTFDYKNIFSGFYIIPIDTGCNNERVYVTADPEFDIAIGTAAEA